jgi:hypothetical protein
LTAGKTAKDFFMQKNILKLIGIIASVTVIGFGLAGCDTGANDSVPEEEPGTNDEAPVIPSGTLTLASSADNTFTLTLSGGLTWKSYPAGIVGNLFFELDGVVTAPDPDGYNRAIQNLVDLEYTVTRTSDTVLTVTLSQKRSGISYYFGSGRLKLKDLSAHGTDSASNSDLGAELITEYSSIGEDIRMYYYIKDGNPLEAASGKLTTASGSGSVSFNIPKHVE